MAFASDLQFDLGGRALVLEDLNGESPAFGVSGTVYYGRNGVGARVRAMPDRSPDSVRAQGVVHFYDQPWQRVMAYRDRAP